MKRSGIAGIFPAPYALQTWATIVAVILAVAETIVDLDRLERDRDDA
ncbi:MAG: hypothetical protein AB8I69_19945 [Anaerolineae bacterium]